MGYDSIISDHTETLIACKARQICRRQDFGAAERDDVQQDLWLHLMAKRTTSIHNAVRPMRLWNGSSAPGSV